MGESQTAQAAPNRLGVKIYEQAGGQASEPQIGNELRLMNRQQALDSLDFDNELGLHDEVQTIAAFEVHALVPDGQRLLLLEAQPAQPKLVSETDFIGRFKQTRAELPVDFDARAYDASGTIPKSFRPSVFLCHSPKSVPADLDCQLAAMFLVGDFGAE